MRPYLPIISAVLLTTACEEPQARPAHLSWVELRPLVAEPGRHDVEVLGTDAIVPGAGLPAEVTLGASNNNLDVARWNGRTYLVFRTAPDHFASTATRLYVVSSTDESTWRYETEFAYDTDLREPRFAALPDRLVLYFAVLGSNPLRFEPMGWRRVELDANGWGTVATMDGLDRIPWRARYEDGEVLMTAYTGGEHVYDFSGDPLEVEFLRSTDGRSFTPVGSRPSLYSGGSSETDWARAANGDLYFVMRTEALDPSGIGSKICVAEGGDVDDLYCRTDPKKYDSPLVFEHDGEIYLIGRRNLTDTGYYGDPGTDYTAAIPGDVILTQLEYRNAPKRCALWRIVKSELRVAYLMDLPSNGDTCFASILDGATPDEKVVYNYSSDPFGPELTWIEGQEGETNIYRHVLRFTRR